MPISGARILYCAFGWKADIIQQFFLHSDDYMSNDEGGLYSGNINNPLGSDIHDWNITSVDTGLTSTIGERLKAVEQYLHGEKVFLANYTDGLTDLYLPDLIEFHSNKQVAATFLSVKPKYNSFHAVTVNGNGLVEKFEPVEKKNIWMNGGFFILTTEIFKYIKPGEELVEQPFERMIASQQLYSFKYDGFWACMDTFKEKEILDTMYTEGKAPWVVWC